jgi:uncharacterized membrane protein
MSAGNHIRNPLELVFEQIGSAFADAGEAVVRPRIHLSTAAPVIRRIGAGDLADALRKGVIDFGATRADVLFICLIYPAAGLVLARLAFSYNLLPLIFPLIAGFALLGPLAAIGLYEISRRREQGLPANWLSAFDVFKSPALGSILWLGSMLLGLFVLWLAAAYGIYLATLGSAPPTSISGFLHDVFLTPGGWAMIVAGLCVGFVFAVVALAISVVSFPLLLDRNVGMTTAIAASVRAVAANPGTMALWGAIVVGALILGSIPALFGLIFVMPVLGHATWHLYRKVIADS